MNFLNNLIHKTVQAQEAAQQEFAQQFESLIKVPRSVRESRMDTCNNCEHLTQSLKRCNLCGCFMELKTWLPQVSCPARKWDAHVIATDQDHES